jgi:hypothetical protein
MSRRSHLIAWTVTAAAIAAACGGAVSLAPGDAGAVGDSGASDGGEDSTGSETGGGSGSITLQDNVATSGYGDAGVWVNRLAAAFYAGAPQGCTLPQLPDAGCAAVAPECADGGSGGTMPVSAGTLTLLGAASGPISATPGPDGTYGITLSYANVAPPLLPPGSSATVSASGAVVPAFANRTWVVPPFITLTAPPLDVPLPTSGDVVFAWTGGVPGAQVVLFFVSSPESQVYCAFDAMAGQGVVPQAVVAGFQQGGELTWGQISSTTFNVGTWTIQLGAETTESQPVPPCDNPDEPPCTPCGPSNCPYCCNDDGACMWGTGDTACGTGGVACVACTGGQHCVNEGCQ